MNNILAVVSIVLAGLFFQDDPDIPIFIIGGGEPISGDGYTLYGGVGESFATDEALSGGGFALFTGHWPVVSATRAAAFPTILTLEPPADATGVYPNTDFTITFDKPVQVGTGDIVIERGAETIEVIPVTSERVKLFANVVVIDPATLLNYEDTYTITLPARGFYVDDGPIPPPAYLRINNNNISITPNERPEIVLQFGNETSETIENVGILCLTTDEVYLTGARQTRPFDDASIAPGAPGVVLAEQAISFPAVESYLGLANGFVDIAPGQNYNVSFNVEIRQDANADTNGGQVLCALVDGTVVAEAVAALELGADGLTGDAVVAFVSQAGVLAGANVNVR